MKRNLKYLHSNKKFIDIIFIISVLLPFLMAVWFDVTGNVPFWYDNARDLYNAWLNLSNPTLIGPPSGIQGIFYGPYWIWLLSITSLFSKDPRVAVFLAGILPYFLIFPVVLYLFKHSLKKLALIALWIFFIFNIGIGYATNLWNPHPAPLLLLLVIYLLVSKDFRKKDFKSLFAVFIAGVTLGLIVNFHISLGFGVVLGVGLFFMIKLFILFKKKNFTLGFLKQLFAFGLGFVITFSPYLLFEIRNGFLQSKTFYSAIFGPKDLVGMEGLSQVNIVLLYLGRAGDLLGVGSQVLYAVLFLFISILAFSLLRKTIKFSEPELNLLLILLCFTIGITGLYLIARNPVWAYHFIGVEIIFLLFFAFMISKFRMLLFLFLFFAGMLTLSKTITFFKTYENGTEVKSSLNFKTQAVESILRDAEREEFAFYAYSPSIYIYEYTYLFKWVGKKDVPYDPGVNQKNDSLIYLIVPSEESGEVLDFINFRANPEKYVMSNSWEINDDIIIIKFRKNEK